MSNYSENSTRFLQRLLEDLRKMRDDFLSGYHEEYPHSYYEYESRLISLQTRIQEFQENGEYEYYLKYSDEDSSEFGCLNHDLLYSLLKRSYIKKYDWKQKNPKTYSDEVIWPDVTSVITDIENVLQVQADTMEITHIRETRVADVALKAPRVLPALDPRGRANSPGARRRAPRMSRSAAAPRR